MKSVMLSIQPKWCELIANGKKTIEVRKTRPKLELPFKCYIYCTSIKSLNLSEYCNIHTKTNGMIDDWNMKVIGEFVCDEIEIILNKDLQENFRRLSHIIRESCLSVQNLKDYLMFDNGYAWHISDLKIYDEPRELGEFKKPCINKNDFPLTCKSDSGCCEHLHRDCHNGCYALTRPPQSWCYVEEVTE